MTAQLSTVDAPGGSKARDGEASPLAEILRDITRGGLAGLLVGILVAGVGGRVAMRISALLVPSADGAFTENGNRVGDITVDGTAALVLFVGLFFGAVIGSLWVVVRPWLPRSMGARCLVSIPLAIALGTRGLIEASNPDFRILGFDPLVVLVLLTLVGLAGPAVVVTDGWLDRRLPHPGPGDRRVLAGYTVITLLGLVLTVLAVVPLYLASPLRPVGIALAAVGIATLLSWWFRSRDQPSPPWLTIVGRVGIVVATVAGLWVITPDVRGALGLF
jgi:hypothetical protein